MPSPHAVTSPPPISPYPFSFLRVLCSHANPFFCASHPLRQLFFLRFSSLLTVEPDAQNHKYILVRA